MLALPPLSPPPLFRRPYPIASPPPPLLGRPQYCPVGKETAKTRGEARTASGSIGRSAASPLTAPAALRFAPCGLSSLLGASHLHVPFSCAPSVACWHVADVPGVQGQLEAWKFRGLEAWFSRWGSAPHPTTSPSRACRAFCSPWPWKVWPSGPARSVLRSPGRH